MGVWCWRCCVRGCGDGGVVRGVVLEVWCKGVW